MYLLKLINIFALGIACVLLFRMIRVFQLWVLDIAWERINDLRQNSYAGIVYFGLALVPLKYIISVSIFCVGVIWIIKH